MLTLEGIFQNVVDSAQSDPDKIPANTPDTFSWLFYQTYWHLEHPGFGMGCISQSIFRFCQQDELLKKAREFCAYVWRGKNSGVFVASSISRQRSRSERIMNPNQVLDGEEY